MPDNIKTKHDADKAISDWLDNQTKQGKVQDISRAHWDEDDDPRQKKNEINFDLGFARFLQNTQPITPKII